MVRRTWSGIGDGADDFASVQNPNIERHECRHSPSDSLFPACLNAAAVGFEVHPYIT